MLLRVAAASAAVAAIVCVAPVQAAAPSLQHWLDGASGIENWIRGKQEHLHTIPELMFDTPKTYAALEETMRELKISYRCSLRATLAML